MTQGCWQEALCGVVERVGFGEKLEAISVKVKDGDDRRNQRNASRSQLVDRETWVGEDRGDHAYSHSQT